jgi:hypothetical protein
LLLNCRHAPDEVWDALPRPVQEQILVSTDPASSLGDVSGAVPGRVGGP